MADQQDDLVALTPLLDAPATRGELNLSPHRIKSLLTDEVITETADVRQTGKRGRPARLYKLSSTARRKVRQIADAPAGAAAA